MSKINFQNKSNHWQQIKISANNLKIKLLPAIAQLLMAAGQAGTAIFGFLKIHRYIPFLTLPILSILWPLHQRVLHPEL